MLDDSEMFNSLRESALHFHVKAKTILFSLPQLQANNSEYKTRNRFQKYGRSPF